jgi:hypothetical protein
VPSFLEDKHAIEQVYILYCDAIDTKTFDRLVGVFTPDTIGDYSTLYGGAETLRKGRDEIIRRMHWGLGVGSNCGATHHTVGNFIVEVTGDTARAQVNYTAMHRGVGRLEGALYQMWGQYQDELVRTPEGWRVSRRRYISMLREGPVVTMRE